MIEHDEAVISAFDALRDAVADLQLRERKTLIQGVKPNLQVKTGGQFDERALGFEAFGDFVRAAAAAGVIRLTRERHGLALSVPASAGPGPSPIRSRIHHDLWRAFTDWSHERRYAWNDERRAVESFPAQGGPPIPGHLVPIPHASEEEQLAWAREFLDRQKGSRVAAALRASLGGDGAYGRFSLLIRSDARLEGEWHDERRSRIADAIRGWAIERGLDVDPYMTDQVVAIASADDPDAEGSVERLRLAVKAAVDKMSAAELRELRLPLGSLEGSGL